MPKSTFTLDDLEIATLQAIWKGGESDVRGLRAWLGGARGVILSTMEHLHRKDLLRCGKVSHAYLYSPAESCDTVMVKAAEAALHHFGTGSRKRFMAVCSSQPFSHAFYLKRALMTP